MTFLFIIFSITVPGYSVAELPVVEIDFVRVNNLGLKQSDHLKIFKSQIQLGKVRLTSQEALKIARWIQSYKSISTQDRCAAGTFELRKTSDSKLKKESGCAEGAAYRELLQQFQRLSKMPGKER